MSGEFSVYQFFPDETYEKVRSNVDATTALEAARHYIHSVGAKIGTTVRVIITDGGDSCCFEWVKGKGVVFPKEEHVERKESLEDRTNRLNFILGFFCAAMSEILDSHYFERKWSKLNPADIDDSTLEDFKYEAIAMGVSEDTIELEIQSAKEAYEKSKL